MLPRRFFRVGRVMTGFLKVRRYIMVIQLSNIYVTVVQRSNFIWLPTWPSWAPVSAFLFYCLWDVCDGSAVNTTYQLGGVGLQYFRLDLGADELPFPRIINESGLDQLL